MEAAKEKDMDMVKSNLADINETYKEADSEDVAKEDATKEDVAKEDDGEKEDDQA